MNPSADTLTRRFGQALFWRLPILALVGGLFALYVGIPYHALSADVTTFGLMGNDLLRLGYLPSLTYGQNYLFSITPYLYAAIRWLSPDTSPVMALTYAGSLLSLGGLWLMYEALLVAEDTRGRRRFLPLALFCLLIAGSWNFIFDISIFSSMELAMALFGITLFAAAKIERSFTFSSAPSPFWWGLLGLAFGSSLASRPQMAIFIAVAVVLLIVRQPGGWRARVSVGFAFIIGAFAGYLPMLLHNLYRAEFWPFERHIAPGFEKFRNVIAAGKRFFTIIAPRIFGITPGDVLFGIVSVLWIVATLVFYFIAKRRKQTATLDQVLAISALILVLIMLIFPRFSFDIASRRYCLHIFPVVVWLFVRFAPAKGWGSFAATGLVVAMIALAVPAWRGQLRIEIQANRDWRIAEAEAVPKLREIKAPILAPYWDTYVLAFLADGTVKIEAYPWEIMVRTYGLIPETEMQQRAVWMILYRSGRQTMQTLQSELGNDAMKTIHVTKSDIRLDSRRCELWEFPSGTEAVQLMKKFHPRYFTTPYPPGSGPQAE